MATFQTHTTKLLSRIFKTSGDTSVRELQALAAQYPSRALFATRCRPEDQVVADLIFRHSIPVRVFAHAGSIPHDLLMRSVDFFPGEIELLTQQGQLAARQWAQQHPGYAAALGTAVAPLYQVLNGHHLLITSLRRKHVPALTPRLEWDEARQRAIFHPLLDWSDAQVETYLRAGNIPYARPAIAPAPATDTAPQPVQHALVRSIFPIRKPDSTQATSGFSLFVPALGSNRYSGLLE